jgi:gamma-glutamyltranspeptidase / glutathione hydrolase
MRMNRLRLLSACGLLLIAGLALATPPKHPAIASANAQATDAGMEVLAAGGNAFDAAVAVSATLGLVEPESSGIGGGGFFLLHLAKEDRYIFIDARERAPLAASRDMFLGEDGEPVPRSSIDGALAAAIPGLPAGLVHLSRKYGQLPLSKSLAPAIRLAREGWTFSSKNALMLGFRREVLAADPAAAALFLRNGKVPLPGTRMRNPDYAAVLEKLAAEGHEGFYRGALPNTLVEGVRAAGGIWSLEDFERYAVVEREPLSASFGDYRIITAPPPSSGGIAIAQVLNILSGYDWAAQPRLDRIHLSVEAMRRAYRDRAIHLGDPDHVEVPVELLMSPHYAAGLRAGIHPQRATPSDLLPGVGMNARPDTTHFSLLDTQGNLVAVTQTVNLPYGNAMVVPGTGFLLNNEMDDFSVKAGAPNAFGLVGEDANAIAPGKRPLSSMSPSILIGPERTAIIGTPGGSRIISMVILGLLNLMDGGGAQATAELPRFHHQYLPDAIAVEPGALSAEEIEALKQRGHAIELVQRPWGNMQVVVWNRSTGAVEAGTDKRWGNVGKAADGRGDGESIFR